MNRAQTLETALKVVTSRQVIHGNPEDSFSIIADLWEMYLAHKAGLEGSLSGLDVANMMTLFKIGRSIGNPDHEDSYVDACGYQAIACELASKQKF